jgi:hypothetical protein
MTYMSKNRIPSRAYKMKMFTDKVKGGKSCKRRYQGVDQDTKGTLTGG